MTQMGQFIINHWELWLAFVGILLLIYVNELLARKNRAKELSPPAAVHLINNDNAVVVDLRDAETFRKGHIIDSIRANTEDFAGQGMEKYKTRPLILVCAKGLQSATLATKLQEQGFTQVTVLAGGIASWQAAELPLVKGK